MRWFWLFILGLVLLTGGLYTLRVRSEAAIAGEPTPIASAESGRSAGLASRPSRSERTRPSQPEIQPETQLETQPVAEPEPAPDAPAEPEPEPAPKQSTESSVQRLINSMIELADELPEEPVDQWLIRANLKKKGLKIEQAELDTHYAELDKRFRTQSKGKMNIDDALKKEGVSKAEFMERLRLQFALRKLAEIDLESKNISPGDQKQWLISKRADARVEQDPKKLPKNAAARVYDDFITYEDFGRALAAILKPRELLATARSRLEAIHALNLLEKEGIKLDAARRDAQYRRFKKDFEANPKFENIPFDDFIRQQAGTSIEAYKQSPTFTREAALFLLGEKLVPANSTAARYEALKEHYGPLKHVRHIFLKAHENPKNKDLIRSFPDAKRLCEQTLERINRGSSFDDFVKTISEDLNSKFKGGTLQVFTPAALKNFKPIEEALVSMKEGDIRGPIKSKRGYHIIKLESIKPAPTMTPQIATEVRKRVALDHFLDTYKKARVGIDLRRFMQGARSQ